MKQELQLKIQAWVDGELSAREADRIGDLLAQDAEAGELAFALRQVKLSLKEHAPELALPETREFYWSKIERQIRAGQRAGHPVAPAGFAWRRWLMPFAGVTALVCALLITREEMRPPTYDEISAGDDGMEAVTFHDQSADMTVVWLQDRPSAALTVPEAAIAPVSFPDPGESAEQVE